MKVIIAGGRDFKPTIDHSRWLSEKLIDLNCSEVISGTCTGADVFGEVIAGQLGITIKRFYPDWNVYGRIAGPIRNEKMAKYSDTCILFPGGKGTKNMESLAEFYHLKIIKWSYK